MRDLLLTVLPVATFVLGVRAGTSASRRGTQDPDPGKPAGTGAAPMHVADVRAVEREFLRLSPQQKADLLQTAPELYLATARMARRQELHRAW